MTTYDEQCPEFVMPNRPHEHWSWKLLPIVAGLVILFALASVFLFPDYEQITTPTSHSHAPS
jgi:hypothetical protein